MTYIVLAWQPGSLRYVAKAGDDVGFLDGVTGAFAPDVNALRQARSYDYGFYPLGPYRVESEGLLAFGESLLWP